MSKLELSKQPTMRLVVEMKVERLMVLPQVAMMLEGLATKLH